MKTVWLGEYVGVEGGHVECVCDSEETAVAWLRGHFAEEERDMAKMRDYLLNRDEVLQEHASPEYRAGFAERWRVEWVSDHEFRRPDGFDAWTVREVDVQTMEHVTREGD